jgi:hypothetical protein
MTTLEIQKKTVTFQELITKVKRMAYLTTFAFDEVAIDGSNDDMQYFCTRALKNHLTLEKVSWRNVTMTDASIDLDAIVSTFFATVPNLAFLSLENCRVSVGTLCCVAYCGNIKVLILRSCNLRDKDALFLAQSLARLPSIQAIDLSGNYISEFGCHSVRAVLKKNPMITQIKMDFGGTEQRRSSPVGSVNNVGKAKAA